MEEWRDVIGFEGYYQISNTEIVKSLGNNKKRKEKILKKAMSGKKRRYLFVALSKNGVAKHYYIHRLIAKHFIENPHNLECVNHINNDSLDNRVENLEWCTMKYNVRHAWDNNYCNVHGVGRKLSDRQVIEIKALIKFDIPVSKIANEYNMSISAIGFIKSGRSFKNI